MARLRLKVHRRKSFWDRFLEELFVALLDEAAKNPNGSVGRWVGRALIVATILLALFVVVVVGAVVAVLVAASP